MSKSFDKNGNSEKSNVGFDPATIAALITASATAAGAASTTLANLLSNRGNKSKDPTACLFINDTPNDWTAVDGFGTPVHGTVLFGGSEKVLNLIDGKQENNSKDSSEKSYEENNNTMWAVKSNNEGSEILIVYYNKEAMIYASFYAKNPYSGAPEAGVSLSSQQWFDENRDKEDKQGKWMINHIRKIQSELCQFAKQGNRASVKLDKFKVSFLAGQDETRFEMTYQDFENS